MPCPQTLGQLHVRLSAIEQFLAAAFNVAIRSNNEGSVHLRNLFDVFRYFRIKQIAVLGAVTTKRSSTQIATMFQYLAMVADYKE